MTRPLLLLFLVTYLHDDPLSVAKNLVLQHPELRLSLGSLGASEKGNILVRDEILHYVQNDKGGALALVSNPKVALPNAPLP
jgi:hypothetical protein